MAKLGLLKNGCTQGTQEIEISTWHKVDVDGESLCIWGKNILGFKNPTTGSSDPVAAPLLYVGESIH